MASDASAFDCLVIGAGLAGAACAHALAQCGAAVKVLKRDAGASQLPAGLLAAHLSAQDIPASQLSRLGVSRTLSHCQQLLCEGTDWQRVRVQQRVLDADEKFQRLRQAAQLLPDWFDLQGDHILHLQAAWIKPQRLVQAWLAHPAIAVQEGQVAALRKSDLWQALDQQGNVLAQAPYVITAAGVQSAALLATCAAHFKIDWVAGAVAVGLWEEGMDQAQVYSGNGHWIGGVGSDRPHAERFWLSGSTYERDMLDSPEQQEQASLQANRERMSTLLPKELFTRIDAQFAQGQVQNWRGLRCTTSDRLPVVGEVAQGLFVCTALGSRGLSFASICADIIASMLASSVSNGKPSSKRPLEQIPSHLVKALQAQRKALRVTNQIQPLAPGAA